MTHIGLIHRVSRGRLVMALAAALAWASPCSAQTKTFTVDRVAATAKVTIGSSTFGSGPLTIGGVPTRSSGESVVFIDGSGNVLKGTLGRADLPSAIAYEDEANAFTQANTFASNVGTSGYASQTTGWRITSAGGADFRYLFTDELHAREFVVDLVRVSNGVEQWAHGGAPLGAAFTCPTAGGTATLTIEDYPSEPNAAAFQASDWVVVRGITRSAGSVSITECVGTVSSYSDQAGGLQSWTFTRGSGGCAGAMSNGTVTAVGSTVVDYGTSGSGYAEVNAVDGAWGANAPYFQIVTWATCPVAANRTVQTRFGQLNGAFGYSSSAFGLAAGSTTTGRLTADPTNGVSLQFASGALTLNSAGLQMTTPANQVVSQNAVSWPIAGDSNTVLRWGGWHQVSPAFGVLQGVASDTTGARNLQVKLDATSGASSDLDTAGFSATAANTGSAAGSTTASMGASYNNVTSRATMVVEGDGTAKVLASLKTSFQTAGASERLQIRHDNSASDPGVPWLRSDGTTLVINGHSALVLNGDRTSGTVDTAGTRFAPVSDNATYLGLYNQRWANINLALSNNTSPAYVVTNLGGAGADANTALGYFVGLSATVSVRKGDDSGSCTLTVVVGLISATTC